MAYRLPPLNSMRLFEAADRRLSFKLAAEDLNLTPSAISHGIQALEDWLSVELFVRGNRSLTLTGAGATDLPQVRNALELIARASEGIPGRCSTGRLSISVSPTFAIRWLLPRLQRFNARHPHIEVSVDTTHRQIASPRDGIGVAIRLGRGNWPELYATCLIRQYLVPVCKPTLAATLHTPRDLANVTLLHVVDVTEDWEVWSDLAGMPRTHLSRGLDTIHMAIEAAAEGIGVASGRLPLIEADVAARRVVSVLASPVKCATGYWLVAGQESHRRSEGAASRDWIRDELGEKAKTPRAMAAAALKSVAVDKYALVVRS